MTRRREIAIMRCLRIDGSNFEFEIQDSGNRSISKFTPNRLDGYGQTSREFFMCYLGFSPNGVYSPVILSYSPLSNAPFNGGHAWERRRYEYNITCTSLRTR